MKQSLGEDRYYRLDNSAVFMAAIAGASGPFVYRMYCVLKRSVEHAALEAALKALHPRFPAFFVCLRHGVFWHYLDPLSSSPRVERERPFPCARIPHGPGRPLIRISAYGRRIACEFHHVVTDGTGSLIFLRALTAEYLRRTGDAPADAPCGDLPRPGDAVEEGEDEDAYARYFRSAATVPDPRPPAFLLPGRRMPEAYRETVGAFPLDELLRLAKERRVTLTEFLTAVYLDALQERYESLPRAQRRRAHTTVAVQVPVNLRKIYPSNTLRNFFLFAAPSLDLRLGHWSFDEILHRVHHQLRLGMEEKELVRQLKRNVGGERNPLGRPILLPLKTLVLRMVNLAIGVGAYSGSLSNLGALDFPDPFGSCVERFGFVPSRARSTGANVGVFSMGDRLYISIGSSIRDRDFERIFFRKLVSFGPVPAVETNMPYNDGGY